MSASFRLYGLLANEHSFEGTRALIPDALQRRAERQQAAVGLGVLVVMPEVVAIDPDFSSDLPL